VVVSTGRERNPLDRHFAMQELVARAPHDAEAAGPKALQQAVAPQHERVGTRWVPAPVTGCPAVVDEGLRRLHRVLRFGAERVAPCLELRESAR
jgi:hypothetical protein